MGARDDYAAVLKSGAESLGSSALIASLIAEAPIFSFPPLKWLAQFFIDEMLERLIQKTEFGAFFLYIDLRVSSEGRDFFEAVQKLSKVKASGTAKEKADAQAEMLRKFNTLVLLRT